MNSPLPGFSLVEMLVVIAIIGIIAAIAIPNIVWGNNRYPRSAAAERNVQTVGPVLKAAIVAGTR